MSSVQQLINKFGGPGTKNKKPPKHLHRYEKRHEKRLSANLRDHLRNLNHVILPDNTRSTHTYHKCDDPPPITAFKFDQKEQDADSENECEPENEHKHELNLWTDPDGIDQADDSQSNVGDGNVIIKWCDDDGIDNDHDPKYIKPLKPVKPHANKQQNDENVDKLFSEMIKMLDQFDVQSPINR